MSTGTNKICVVYATDGNSVDVCRMSWSMRSLTKYATFPFDIVVLSDTDIQCPDRLDSRWVGKYKCITDARKYLRDVGIFDANWSRSWPFTVIYRLVMPLHPAFSEYDYALYLDTDTLILSGAVDRVLSIDISGFEVAGSYDIDGDNYDRIDSLLSKDIDSAMSSRLVSVYGDSIRIRSYVNAGVLIFNLNEIRKDSEWYEDRLISFWKSECRGLFKYLDQDFINAMMHVKSGLTTMINWQRGGYPNSCIIRHYILNQKDDMTSRAVELGVA